MESEPSGLGWRVKERTKTLHFVTSVQLGEGPIARTRCGVLIIGKAETFDAGADVRRCRTCIRLGGALTPEEQVRRWVAGSSECPNTDGECCPDFSCCRPRLLWPVEKREAFARASRPGRERMLVGSLSAMVADSIGRRR